MENKVATTIEQSITLINLGIDVCTADMFYNEEPDETYPKDIVDTKYPMIIGEGQKHYLEEYGNPAWSLVALMDILPAGIKDYKLHIIKDNVIKGYFCSYRNKKNEVFVSTSGFNVIDAVLEMIVYLKENKLI